MSDWTVHKIDFDEEWYLAQNQDVAEAVKVGGLRSALDHYTRHGYAEGRLPVPPRGEPASQRDVANDRAPPLPVVELVTEAVIVKETTIIEAPPPVQPEPPAPAPAPITAEAPAPLIREAEDPVVRHAGLSYLVPPELRQSELTLRRAALIGSCFVRDWGFQEYNPSNCPVDFFLVNNAQELPPRSREDIAQYDFQVIQVPLRAIMPDGLLWRLSYSDYAAYEAAFKTTCQRLEMQLQLWMKYNAEHSLLTFVANFFLPQESATGRLLPRYDLRNPVHFIQKLNEFLEQLVLNYRNAYILDTDKLSASFGRRYVQDDGVAVTTHGGLFPLTNFDETRIERLEAMSAYYEIRWPEEFRAAVWSEITTMVRTVRQLDMVKLVVVDLDDTLWNGVSGDMADISPFMIEGWPLGLIEALLYLKQRGVMLAIVSKNDETRIRQIWDEIFVGRLSLDDFAALRINWRPKAENMQEIIDIVNITPRSVLFIDDNPVERAAMQHAFPGMRVIGRNPYFLRRILLWSAETQVAFVTDESHRRTEMMQAQFTREETRSTVSRADFLASAAPRVTMIPVLSTSHKRFPRVIELINKTNQFNTTGRRWTLEECEALLQNGGGAMAAFEVSDAFTNYGLVGVVILGPRSVEQWVMSCRVLGYEIEQAVMAYIVQTLRKIGAGEIKGLLVETDANHPCRDLFEKCGYQRREDHWVLPAEAVLGVPSHIAINVV